MSRPRSLPRHRLVFILTFAAVLVSSLLPTAASGLETVAGEVVIGFEPEAAPAERSAARADAGVAPVRALGTTSVQLVRTDEPVAEAIAALERQPGVAWAEPNYVVRASAPSDPRLGHQWGLRNTGQVRRGIAGTPGDDSGAARAWTVTTGSASVLVAIVDSGVDLDHPDLAANIWTNPAPGATGCGQDLHGCDFTTYAPSGDPDDDNGHGSHVAGIVGAVSDNAVGGAGVCWSCKLLPVKVLGANGSGTTAAVAAGINYATARGARVVNLSLGSSFESSAVRSAIRNAPDVLMVAAAGNGDDDGVGYSTDARGEYPCATNLANVVCVAATNNRDALAPWSNFGAATVDLAAPGVDVISTYRSGGYASMDGTSMATPFVAGAAALAFAVRPAASAADVKTALLSTAVPRSGLAGRVATGARLDAAAALAQLTGTTAPPLPPADTGDGTDPGTPPVAPPTPSTPPAPPAPPAIPAPAPAPVRAAPAVPAPAETTPADEDEEPPTPRPTAPRPAAPLPVPAGSGLLDRRVAVVRLRCPKTRGAAWCEGRLALRAKLAARAGSRAALRSIGSRGYALAPGASATYRVALGRLAAGTTARRLVVQATVSDGTRSKTRRVTLRRF